MKKVLYSLSIIALVVSLNSCKKEDAGPSNQTLKLHVHNVVGSDVLNYSNTFTTSTGQRFTLSEFRYYVSGISLLKNDGTKLPITGKYFLVSPSVSDYDLGSVPVGDYKGLEFSVGIDSAANHSDPATYEPTNPLAIQTPAIHWSWNSGYIFVKLEGKCDTTVGNNGALDQDLIYHLGLDASLRTVTLNTSFTVSKDNAKSLTMVADLRKYLTGANFRTVNETHTFDNLPFATQLANNISSMFSIQ
jgi:hypothetical protein